MNADRKKQREGARFEQDLARMFRRLGYRVKTTPASNDHGADLLLSKGRKHIAVQAKHYGKPVGNKAVQEAYAAMAFYGCNEAWVVTNAGFTDAAREQAEPCGVRLVDGHQLNSLSREAKARSIAPAVLALLAVAAVTIFLVFTAK